MSKISIMMHLDFPGLNLDIPPLAKQHTLSVRRVQVHKSSVDGSQNATLSAAPQLRGHSILDGGQCFSPLGGDSRPFMPKSN